MEEKQIGVITHYFAKVSAGIIELTDSLKVGDTIHIRGAHDDITQKVESIEIEHKHVEEAQKGDAVGVQVKQKVHPNDKVFKAVE